MKNIYSKLYQVKQEVGAISRDSKNPFFNSKYFDINSLLKHVEPILEKHNLLLLQPIESGEVASVIIDVDSEERITSAIALPQIQDPQKLGSAITYYRRYTLQSLLSLQAEDDDANLVSQSTQKKKSWVNQDDKIWQAAVDKGVKLSELKKHYNISKANEEIYPIK